MSKSRALNMVRGEERELDNAAIIRIIAGSRGPDMTEHNPLQGSLPYNCAKLYISGFDYFLSNNEYHMYSCAMLMRDFYFLNRNYVLTLSRSTASRHFSA